MNSRRPKVILASQGFPIHSSPLQLEGIVNPWLAKTTQYRFKFGQFMNPRSRVGSQWEGGGVTMERVGVNFYIGINREKS